MPAKIIGDCYHPNENKPEMYRAGENKLVVEMLDLGAAGSVIVPGAEQRQAPIGVVIHVGPGTIRDGAAKVAPFAPGDHVVLTSRFVIGKMPDAHKRDRILAYWEAVLAIIEPSEVKNLNARMFTHMQLEVPKGIVQE